MSMIPYDDRDCFIWFDGQLIPFRDAKLHVLTHALHYASCVFEGERAYDGEIFHLTEHSQRLYDSAKLMDYTLTYSVSAIAAATRATVAANKMPSCNVRPVAWRGSENIGRAHVCNPVTQAHIVCRLLLENKQK